MVVEIDGDIQMLFILLFDLNKPINSLSFFLSLSHSYWEDFIFSVRLFGFGNFLFSVFEKELWLVSLHCWGWLLLKL